MNSGGDWGLSAGLRTAFIEEPAIEADSEIALRVRYAGAHGPSEWSNVLTLNGGGTQDVPDSTNAPATELPATFELDASETVIPEEKCSLCGFCPTLLGLCIFIWIAIALAIIIIVVVIIVITRRRKNRK